MQALTSDKKFLLKSLSQRDYTAFWQLWMPYQDYLSHCCLTWMDGNVTNAQDALSQATLKAWDKLPHHADKITNLKAWLTRFTHNVCMDIHREHRTKAIGIDNFEEIAGQVEVVTFPVESPESAILGREMEITVHRIIKALPPRLRSPFIMRFEQDMSYLDIAEKLGISIDNVYKRISQARSILKQQMNKYILQEDDSALLEIPLPSIKTQKPIKAGGEVLHNGGMQCLYCLSTHICKNGNRKGKQNYVCKKCDRQFINSYSSKRYPSEVRERCLKLYAHGMGYRAIGRETGVSHNTVINWIRQDVP
jgi:RNA polymerase sigma factor (sigma-70 family)